MSKDIIDRLPPHYQMIYAIRSPYLRAKLATDIEAFGMRVEELRQLELTEDTQRIIRQFTRYLNKTCENPATIQKWGGWLSKYTATVLDIINRIQNKVHEVSGKVNLETIDHFDKLVLILSNSVHDFAIRQNGKTLPHDRVCKFLSSIINETENIIPDLNDPRYILITTKILTLNDRLVQITSIPNCHYFDHEFLSSGLKEIDYLTKRYALGWTF